MRALVSIDPCISPPKPSLGANRLRPRGAPLTYAPPLAGGAVGRTIAARCFVNALMRHAAISSAKPEAMENTASSSRMTAGVTEGLRTAITDPSTLYTPHMQVPSQEIPAFFICRDA